MKLLFDANLSRKIVPFLKDLFPGSAHITQVGFAGDTPDEDIWSFARENGFSIVTADSDFVRMANTFGPPPQVIRLEQMDYSTAAAAALMRQYAIAISEFNNRGTPLLKLRKSN